MAIEDLVHPVSPLPTRGAGLDEHFRALQIGALAFTSALLFLAAMGLWPGPAIAMSGLLGLVAGLDVSRHRHADAMPPHIRSGIEGEARVLALLRGLPDSCALFNQLHLPNPRSRTGFTECDLVVVSAVGAHLIEVKNHCGLIQGGAEEAPEWTLVRDRGREPMRNPVRQAGIQARVLRRLFQAHGVRVPVYPLVVLSNSAASWQPGETYSVPVVQLRDQAPGDLLTRNRGSTEIGDERWRRAVKTLAALRFRVGAEDRLG
jgi:hypothetical protein